MKKILVIGSTVADIIINLDSLPTTAQDVHIKSQKMSLGGCAYNVSDMIRHFNVPYTLFSPVGTGIYGDFVRDQMALKGLASPMATADRPNGCCYCFVEDSGERTFIVEHGAEYLFYKSWFDQLNMNEIGIIYICGLEIEDKTGGTIVDFLEEHPNIPLCFAPGPRLNNIDTGLMERIFALHPLLHLNEEELYSFTGTKTLRDGVLALYAMTQQSIIITKGASGSYFYDGNQLNHIAPVPAKVVDTIGAGDGHCGAALAGLAKGMTMTEALMQANKAASLVVGQEGAIIDDKVFNKHFESDS